MWFIKFALFNEYTQIDGDENPPEKALTTARKIAPKSEHRMHGGTTIHFILESQKDAFYKNV